MARRGSMIMLLTNIINITLCQVWQAKSLLWNIVHSIYLSLSRERERPGNTAATINLKDCDLHLGTLNVTWAKWYSVSKMCARLKLRTQMR